MSNSVGEDTLKLASKRRSHSSHRHSSIPKEFLASFGASLFLLSIVSVRCYQNYRKLSKYRSEIEKQTKLRQDERNGRIHLEQKLRKENQETIQNNGINMKPIGVIESPFVDRRGTPRQPILVPAARGFIRFNKKIIQFQHFEELSQFSHLWVIFLFHENTNQHQSDSNDNNNNSNGKSGTPNLAKIAPPRLLGKTKVGCLTTRSPHRPNPIGLSLCEIISVGADYIEIRCLDLIHGTPVLDGEKIRIFFSFSFLLFSYCLFPFSSLSSFPTLLLFCLVKPYIPYDLVPSEYELPMVTSSDGNPLKIRPLQVPSWIVDSDIALLPVTFQSEAIQTIQELIVERKLKFCSTVEEATELISQVERIF
jgi:tRNA-Thr(GGU) m(6)t(6)A37 methyltransferase TsaA